MQPRTSKAIPVELKWFPELFSFCHLYALCYGKRSDVCLLLADQEIWIETCFYFFWKENLKKTGFSFAWMTIVTNRQRRKKQYLTFNIQNSFRKFVVSWDNVSGTQFHTTASYFFTDAVRNWLTNTQIILPQVQLKTIPAKATEIRKLPMWAPSS